VHPDAAGGPPEGPPEGPPDARSEDHPGAGRAVPVREPFSTRPVLAVAAGLLVVLLALAQRWGWHRDELYFRLLDPAWGYVDQPPLLPFLVRTLAGVVDEPWAVRLPAAALAAASLVVLALVARELGGGRAAQVLAAVAAATGTLTLLPGHVMLTTSVDLVVWPLVCLFVLRAVLRREPRWWVWAGVVVGLGTWNKLLLAMLLVSLAAGLLVTGRGRALLDRGVMAGGAVAAVLAAPNLVYQATHGWPQLAMGAALAENNADEVRVMTFVFLVIGFGPPLVAVWGAALVALWRRPQWRDARFLGAALPVLVLLTVVAGSQPYYPSGLLAVLVAAGCVPVAGLVARSRGWRVALTAGLVLNAAVSALVALPVLPLGVLGRTPVPGLNQVAADQVGWPRYVEQVAGVWGGLDEQDRAEAVLLASNYGEAGALNRFGPAHGLPAAYSGHNALGDRPRPADTTSVVVVVGGQLRTLEPLFARCEVRARLDNDLDVDNEEQGVPVAVCRDPELPWPQLWERVRHLD
jgi:hypothetical protein